MRPLAFNTLILFCLISPLFSQNVHRYEKPIATPLHIVYLPDSMITPFNQDSLISRSIATSDTVIRAGKSTTVAVLASMVIPGAGQIYNGSYWKAPLIWGVGYYFASVYIQQDKLYKQFRKEYRASVDSAGNSVGDIEIKKSRDFYRNQRDTFGWYLAITYLVNLLDAYVDASLYNFEVSPNLQPTSDMRASVRIPF